VKEDEVVLERRERAGAAWAEIRLNRPEKGNALTMSMIERIGEIVDALARDRETRVVVLRATGRFFCTGGDIEAWGRLLPQEMARDWILPGIDVLERLAALPQPVIAAVTGHALGGGLELALAADLRIAVRAAKVGVPEASLGIIPGWMGTRRLAELAGPARARHLLLLARAIPAAQAYEWGLVTALAEDEADLTAQLDAWLEQLLANAPPAMALIKGLLATVHPDLRHHHAAAAAQAAGTDDCREGVRAFLEKRKPAFRSR
jgi:enoyl-CoA hydratase/carnithine racemase